MEYLMTYGWAILIIAIVMVALFSLGIFNSQEPRVQPGACEVYRSAATSPTLTGECQGVWPQFVAQLDVINTDIALPVSARPMNAFTISFWMNPSSWSNVQFPGIFGGEGLGAVSGGVVLTLDGANLYFEVQNGITSKALTIPANYLPTSSWKFVTLEWDGTSGANALNAYVNGVYVGSTSGLVGPIAWGPQQSQFYIGNADDGRYFQGEMASFQVYNTSLSQAEVTALYQEGIGGAPINPIHIVGWWPLNGNVQDYSGNGNQATATAVTYTSAWTSGYTQP